MGIRKIVSSSLKTYSIVSMGVFFQDSLERVQFFKKTFLLAETSMKMVLEMFSLALSNANVKFDARQLLWRKYIVAKAIPAAKRVELIDKYEFVETAFDKALEMFVIHIAVLEVPVFVMTVHLTRKHLLATWKQDKVLTKVSIKYHDFADVFSPDLAIELWDITGIQKDVIKLIKDKPTPYDLFYSLSLVELETPLKTRLICSSKSPTGALILFDKKSDKNVCLCDNY